ncbi:VOC family protein [Ornithinimicrobium pratense]|uniref:VOC family protein n=1 Tax=Ornithinimicrobium pratense TaxID=2593973 RepID=A0A5J6V253_9MICO|nr:VOC family protein [Ornithinimicrobium pratense]QFG67778.1 VOC family protein [Ornithinimicrobium pratense]
MDQRLSLVTLGVQDLDRARAFYTALGWEPGPSPEHIVFFQAGGMVVALWERAALGVDSGIDLGEGEGEDTPGSGDGWGGINLGLNLTSAADVDEQMSQAHDVGATILRQPGNRYWGGYSGVFADPDGHVWEIAYNPYWSVSEDGLTLLGDGRG